MTEQERAQDEEREITELAEAICNFRIGIKEIKGTIKNFLLSNHYVRLAEDQSLPRNPNLGIPAYFKEYKEAQQDMLTPKDGTVWRKIILKEGKDDRAETIIGNDT